MSSPYTVPRMTLGRKRLWAGVLLAPGAWTFVEGVGYVLSARTCSTGAQAMAPEARLALMIVCGVGLLASLVGLRTSASNLKAIPPLEAREPLIEGRARFMALAGVILSALFIGGIVLFSIPALLAEPCGRAR